jgi:lysophospholipase L1-like esterase
MKTCGIQWVTLLLSFGLSPAVHAGLITGVTGTDDSHYSTYTATKAVDGSGLYGSSSPFQDHRHEGTLSVAQYLSNGTQTPTLVFDLGAVYTLDEIHVWNCNDGRSGNEGAGVFGAYKNFGRGIHSVDILLSTDGVTYSTWKSRVIFTDAPASDIYTGFDLETVAGQNFTGEQARYVKLKVNNNWANGANSGYTGLAEIQFFGVTEVPKVGGVGVSGLNSTSAVVNGTLNDTNGATFVWLGYGTTDGDTNKPGTPGGWSNWIAYDGGTAQSTGALAQAVGGLNASTTYYYRFYASNDTWDAWSATASFATEAAPFVPDGFAMKMKIRFEKYAKSETLTNFPVLVVLSNNVDDSGFNYNAFCGTDGYDLRFAASNGVSEIPYEIEKWNTNAGQAALVWVCVDRIVDTNSYIWAFWGNPSATRPVYTTNGAVWASGFRGVWHMKESSGNIADSTSYRNDSTSVGGTPDYSQSGPVGGAVAFSAAANESFDMGNRASLNPGTAPLTLSAWVRTAQNANFSGVMGKLSGAGYSLQVHNGVVRSWFNAGTVDSAAAVNNNTWRYIAVTRSSAERRNFIDGVSAATGTAETGNADSTADFYIGSWGSTSYDFDGAVDEARISAVARSGDWIWAEFMNMASNMVFIEYSAPESVDPSLPRIVNGAATGITANAAWLNGTLTSTGTSATAVWVFWGQQNCGTNGGSTKWSHTNFFETNSIGPVSYTTRVTNLVQGAGYYFNFYAENASGGVWAVSSGGAERFVTADVPGVDNADGATGVAVVSATINGRITNNNADVYLCWGDNDAGTATTDSWDHVEAMGWNTATSVVSKTLSGLAGGAMYFYTTYATNPIGVAWAGVTSFVTQASAPFLAPNDARIAYSDYARAVTLDSHTARFDRVISGASGNLQYANPAARIRFRTSATNIVASFVTGALGITQGTGVILVDGARAGAFDAGAQNAQVNVSVPVSGGGCHNIELLMPYSQDLRFTGMTVNAEAAFEAVPARPSCRWVAYGDSITEGFWAGDSYANYPSLVAAAKNWEVVNMGFGWRGLRDSGASGSDGTVIGGLGADIVTVLMGYNDAAGGLSAAQYRINLGAFVDRVREQDPTTPIYLISPIYSANNQERLGEYRVEIMDYVRSSEDPRVFFVDGLALGIHAGNSGTYLSDGIHPNNAGFALIAGNLAPQLGATRNTGTPHWWLGKFGFTDYEAAATNDTDGDGVLTWQEYVADTDPTNRLSFLSVLAITNTPPWTVYFESSTGRLYGLQISTNLCRSDGWDWVEGQTNRWGSGTVTTLTHGIVATNGFYRLKVSVP